MKYRLVTFFCAIIFSTLFLACGSIGVFEKNVVIPNHEWNSSFKPTIKVHIPDTSATYNVYFVFRHTNAYQFNNIWIELARTSGQDSIAPQNMNIVLATNDGGWMGSGIDDIYEQRRLINHEGGFKFDAAEQIFRISHLMRKDPLPHVMNVGIRIEKIAP